MTYHHRVYGPIVKMLISIRAQIYIKEDIFISFSHCIPQSPIENYAHFVRRQVKQNEIFVCDIIFWKKLKSQMVIRNT